MSWMMKRIGSELAKGDSAARLALLTMKDLFGENYGDYRALPRLNIFCGD